VNGLPFVKWEAAGNDLVLVDGRRRAVADPAALAVEVCRRHFGVGGDGLLLLEPVPGAAVMMRMFNPDGTEDFCGNGLRCAAAYLFHEGESDGGLVVLRSPRGRHRASVRPQGWCRFEVEVEVLEPRFEPGAIPARAQGKEVLNYPLAAAGRTWSVSCVSVGTAHAVIFTERPVEEEVFREVSPEIERHEMFPQRASVLWCTPEGRGRIVMRVWERGVGETLACGTGACAALVVGRRLGHAGDSAEVVTRGGSLRVAWEGAGAVRLTGPARLVFTGRWRPDEARGDEVLRRSG